jgi:hypothetical protein
MPRGRQTGQTISNGLPSNPRARSVGHYDVPEGENTEYKARTRDSGYHSHHNTGKSTRAPPTRSVRPQRSVGNIMPPRGGSSSHTDVPNVPPLPLPRRSHVSSKSSTSSGSYSLASGSSSSFLDRMKSRRTYGYGSSRTSLEEEADPPRKATGPERDGWFAQRNAAMPEPEYGTFIMKLRGCCGALTHCKFRRNELSR